MKRRVILRIKRNYLFEKLLVRGADDNGVGVAHHGDQHVQQEDGNQDLEDNKDHLGHSRIWTVIQIIVLVFSQSHVEQ